MKIQAAVVREQSGPFDVSELDLAEPKDDEVLVKIVGVGICHTDLVCRDPNPFAASALNHVSGKSARVHRVRVAASLP